VTPTALALRGLRYYWRTNLAVVAGVAIAVSVLAGALVVGSSVKASLRELAVSRLGNVDELVASTGFFRAELAREMAKKSPSTAGFIALDGLAADGSNTRRAANVAIYGVDDSFFAFHGVPAPAGNNGAFDGRQALVSPALARDLGVAAGDSILARLPSPSIVPSATLHGRRDALGKTMRATVRAVLPESGLGVFALRPNQGEVRAIYLPLARVQREIERPDRVNAIVLHDTNDELKPGEFVHTFGDLHLYQNHLAQAREQLTRECRPLPQMQLNGAVKNIHDFQFEDFTLIGYDPHPAIKAAIAV
jgi:hypothetical protein